MSTHEVDPGLKPNALFNILPPPNTNPQDEWLKFLQTPTQDDDPSLLRQQLQNPELSAELAETITANYRNFRKLHPDSHVELAQLQMHYQPLVLELLAVPTISSKVREEVFTLYPVVDSIHGQYELIGSEPTVELLKKEATPAGMRKLALEKWFISIELGENPTEADIQKHSLVKGWLVDFIADWSGEEDADSSYIERTINFLEGQTILQSPPEPPHPGVVMPNPVTYINPQATARVAKHISDEQLRFTFATRHIPSITAIKTEEDVALLEWVSKRYTASDFGNLITRFLGQKKPEDPLRTMVEEHALSLIKKYDKQLIENQLAGKNS